MVRNTRNSTTASSTKTVTTTTRASSKVAALKGAVTNEATTNRSKATPTKGSMSKRTPTKALQSKAAKAQSKAAKVQSKAARAKSKVPYRREDYEVIHGWLGSKANFESVFGHSRQTPVGNLRSPQEAWDELAEILRSRSKNRLVSMAEDYKRVKALHHETGFGITEADRKKGILSLEAKHEWLCPFYETMDKLFGKKPNVVPLGEISMSQTEYLHGVEGYDVEEDEEEVENDEAEEEEEEDDEGNVEGDLEKAEGGDIEEREEVEDEEGLGDSVGSDVQDSEEPDHDLHTLATVAIEHLEERAQPEAHIDFEREDSVGYDFDDDDNYLLEDENNNADLRTEDVEEMSDGNKENEPIQNTPIGFPKRRKTGTNVTTPAKKLKSTVTAKMSNDTTSGKKSKTKDPHKDLPTLVAGAAPQSRNAFAAAFAESYATKIKAMKEIEEFKINFELQSRQMQNILEGKRIDFEQKKLDFEKELLKMKLKHDSDMENTGQKSSIITAALAQGFVDYLWL
ncbi:hypothetical protein CPC16_002490 [Podila verticillata]|nr:hypothetical protein CPC16_002490 [Podila verticillata]